MSFAVDKIHQIKNVVSNRSTSEILPVRVALNVSGNTLVADFMAIMYHTVKFTAILQLTAIEVTWKTENVLVSIFWRATNA